MDAIVEAGAVPRLLQLLDRGTPEVKEKAALALHNIACNNDPQKITLVKAGALPRLLALLKSGTATAMKHNATSALKLLAAADVLAEAGDLRGIAKLLGTDFGERGAALALRRLAKAPERVPAADAAALPRLVELLDSGTVDGKGMAARALELLGDTDELAEELPPVPPPRAPKPKPVVPKEERRDQQPPELRSSQQAERDRHAEEVAALQRKLTEAKTEIKELEAKIETLETATAAVGAHKERWAPKVLEFAWAQPDEIIIHRRDPKSFLGRGSFGTVYKATFHGTPVAAKVFELTGTMSQGQLDQIMKEAAVMHALHHQHLLKLRAIIQDQEKHEIILVTDLCTKGSLFAVLEELYEWQQRGFQERDAWRGAHEVASALKFLHSKNIVHLDLKSPNILVAHGNKMMVADMGVVAFTQTLTSSGRLGSEPQTRADQPDGRPQGSLKWMAPEMMKVTRKPRGEALKPCDVYSFACVLFELQTGMVPWAGITPQQEAAGLLVMAVRDDADRPDGMEGVVVPPNDLTRLMRDCWHQDPTRRPTFTEICVRTALFLNTTVERWTFSMRQQADARAIAGARAPEQEMGLSEALQRTNFPRWNEVLHRCQQHPQVM